MRNTQNNQLFVISGMNSEADAKKAVSALFLEKVDRGYTVEYN